MSGFLRGFANVKASLLMPEKTCAVQFMSLLDEGVPFAERERLCAMLILEDALWKDGFSRIAGVDEAGRGPLAGPIVAAAVILRKPIARLNDSKRLSESDRRALSGYILSGEHMVGVASVSPGDIDAHGIQQANYRVMREAIVALRQTPDFVLVDGFALSGISQPVMRVIKGDARSLNIAAASIVAKVTRDEMLLELDKRYPEYGFANHKGYGTREHLEAIRRFGPCPEHRLSFAPFNRELGMTELF